MAQILAQRLEEATGNSVAAIAKQLSATLERVHELGGSPKARTPLDEIDQRRAARLAAGEAVVPVRAQGRH